MIIFKKQFKFSYKILIASLFIFLTLILITGTFKIINADALSKIGSRGEEVVKIQTKLKELGFYIGNIDSIFGPNTESAVKKFQESKGLQVDGIVGNKTLEALGIISNSGNSSGMSDSDIDLFVKVVSAEARGEIYNGQVAVAAVILNRIDHPSFPNGLSGVIYQPGAFSCLNDGQINEPVADSARRAVNDAINGWDPSNGAIYYYNPAKTNNKWMHSRPVIVVIGEHRFCS